ncbi:unnamed protein product [Penicillium olsonii]|nr:unnamed protein product [Penicillium olsonii]
MPSSQRSGRIGRAKSKTGCDTCKIRRIRCGEEKPSCVKCTSTGRQCAYSVLQPQRALASPFPQWHSGQRERRAFEFYFHQAGPALAGIIDLTFWNGAVLQMCRLEPAVWDAVISLSALYECPPINDSSPFSLIHSPADVRYDYHHEALVWYSRSLAALQQRIHRGVADVTISTIACILFIAIELIQGHRSAAVALYTKGTQLLTDVTTSPASGAELEFLTATTSSIFHRLRAQFLISTDGTLCESWATDCTEMRKQFDSITEARNALADLVGEWKILNRRVKDSLEQLDGRICETSSATQQRRDNLERRLMAWYTSFVPMVSAQDLYPSPQQSDGPTSLLLMTYISILIETQTSLAFNEMVYDKYDAEFTHILEYAPKALGATRTLDGRQPGFMFEMGVFLPLFITALKCRNPKLRRQALKFLLDAPPVQGLCMCSPVVDLIAMIILVEEDLVALDRAESLIGVLAGPGRYPAADKRIATFNVSSYLNDDGRRENRLHLAAYVANAEGRCVLSGRSVLLPSPGSETSA